MSNKDEMQDAVAQFLSLWQEQCEAMTKDSKVIEAWSEQFKTMQTQYLQAFTDNTTQTQDDNTHKESHHATASDAFAGLFRYMVDEFAQCQKRIAVLEARVTELESGTEGKGKDA